MMADVFINDIAVGVPPHECHHSAIDFIIRHLAPTADVSRLRRISENLGIEKRYTVLNPFFSDAQDHSNAFYQFDAFPSTARRMEKYRAQAPKLALDTIRAYFDKKALSQVTHLIITSCTGFYAPGLDVDIVKGLCLSTSVERTMVAYMGCYGAIAGLRLAYHIVRSQPEAVVMMVNLELCSLHWKNSDLSMDQLISFMMFADGCAASLISSKKCGLEIVSMSSSIIENTSEMMGWTIGDHGFFMNLDARIPSAISRAMRDFKANILDKLDEPVHHWAIHPGGRAILDSIQESFRLTQEQMRPSHRILKNFGNMSSPTIMFILRELVLQVNQPGLGCALAFGPGLTMESCIFRIV